MPDRDTIVENKALPLPAAVFRRHFFQIFKNPALQVVHFLNTLPDQPIR